MRHFAWLFALWAGMAAAQDGRFLRLWWYEPGAEHGNPGARFNSRLRVNAPSAVLHPSFGLRRETRSSGMGQILMEEDLFQLDGVSLYLEMWGGHPGTAGKRVTPNGRTTYDIPEVGTAARECTHQYAFIPLQLTDVLNGYNAVQLACDQGGTFWGHFIVDEMALAAALKKRHPSLAAIGLSDFTARVRAAASGEAVELSLDAPARGIASVFYQGLYEGYDENGNRQARDWHGFTKRREPAAVLGTSTVPPYRVRWDTSMLPAQEGVQVRAVVRFRDDPRLYYFTAPAAGLAIARPNRTVKLHPARDVPRPFWSRANRKQACTIALDVDPANVERAELHVAIWDGGRGNTEAPFTLNGHPLPVAGKGAHDVLYRVVPVDARILRRGDNLIELLSDTEHHGIEVLAPGPALMVRY